MLEKAFITTELSNQSTSKDEMPSRIMQLQLIRNLWDTILSPILSVVKWLQKKPIKSRGIDVMESYFKKYND